MKAALKTAGVDDSKVSGLMDEVQKAIDKVKSAGGTGNQRDAIKQAVDGVLKDNGVDIQKFQAAMKAQHHHGHHRVKGSGQNDHDGDDSGAAQGGSLSTTGASGASTEQSAAAALVEQQVTGKGSLIDVAG